MILCSSFLTSIFAAGLVGSLEVAVLEILFTLATFLADSLSAAFFRASSSIFFDPETCASRLEREEDCCCASPVLLFFTDVLLVVSKLRFNFFLSLVAAPYQFNDTYGWKTVSKTVMEIFQLKSF